MEQQNSQDHFKVPAETAEAEIKVKGSRFIAAVFPAATREQAEARYEQVKKKYYNATHNCLAWRIDENTFRYSDDGEPSGTAGKPILQVLVGAGLYEVLCVVTRYFGGTKLGTGGLIRAYTESTALAVSRLRVKTKIKTEALRLDFEYDQENRVRKLVSATGASILQKEYGGKVQMDVAVPQSRCNDFMRQLTEISHSLVEIKKI